MKHKVLGILALLFIVLVLAGCSSVSVRSTSQLFHTGRSLDIAENRVGARAMVYPPFPSSVYYERGLPAGFGLSLGYGIHGIELNGSDADDTDDTNHGPEVYVTKELYSAGDLFYVGAIAGADLNIVPRFDAFVQAGASASLYPVDWFYLSGSVRGGYLVGGTAGALLALGLGIDAPISVRLAGYVITPEIQSQALNAVYWPFGIQLDVSGKF